MFKNISVKKYSPHYVLPVVNGILWYACQISMYISQTVISYVIGHKVYVPTSPLTVWMTIRKFQWLTYGYVTMRINTEMFWKEVACIGCAWCISDWPEVSYFCKYDKCNFMVTLNVWNNHHLDSAAFYLWFSKVPSTVLTPNHRKRPSNEAGLHLSL